MSDALKSNFNGKFELLEAKTYHIHPGMLVVFNNCKCNPYCWGIDVDEMGKWQYL